MPVVILTDQGIATRIEAFEEPNLEKICQDISPDLTPVADHKPYDLSKPDGLTHHVAPGTQILSGKYPIATGLEHDELGHPTGSPKLHSQMTAKRRNKLRKLAWEFPEAQNLRPATRATSCSSAGVPARAPSARPWTAPAARAKRLRVAHQDTQSAAQRLGTNFQGLPPRFRGGNERRGHLRLRPTGHAAARPLLRPRIRGITKSDGLTWKVKEILDRATLSLGRRTDRQDLTLNHFNRIIL